MTDDRTKTLTDQHDAPPGTPTIASRTSKALRARREPIRADETVAGAEQQGEVGLPADEQIAAAESVDAAEPVVDADEPAAGADEPAIDADEPSADVDEPAADADEPAADADEAAADAMQPRRVSRVILTCAAVTAVAAVYAVVAGVVWWRADDAGTRSAGATRDAVVLAATQDIVALNSADYRQAQAALVKWESVSTGKLKGEFTSGGKDVVAALQKAKLVTSATVQDAAVTELDEDKGTATVIASVYLKRQPVSGSATTSRNRFRASLARVGGTWRLSDLAPVAVQL